MVYHLTIRTRIIAWFAGIVACILLVFSIFVYFNFRATLFVDTDDLLELKAQGIVEYIDAYWHEQKRKVLERGESLMTFFKINSSNFIAVAERWLDEIPLDPTLADINVAIYSPDGQLVASSNKSLSSPFLSTNAFADKPAVRSSFATVKQNISDRSKIPLRVLTAPVIEDGALVGILQVTKPLTFVYQSLDRLRVKLLVFWPIALLAVALTGWFLARLILTPLDHIIHTARQISAERLSTRVHTPDTRGEIRELADTFNEMLDNLEQAFFMQKQLTQDISHELRTPLTILRGEIEVTLKKIRSPEEYQATLASSLEEIKKLTHMTESLLVLARLDSGQMIFDRHVVGLDPLIRQIIDDLSVIAHEKNIALRVDVIAPIAVLADEAHLRRAVMNILENAIKYTPENGQVSIKAEKREDTVALHISDTGIGIDLERLPFIFERFYRADASRSGKGFGLGLSISQSIIEAHNGLIEVSSAVGKGTVFLITLPAAHG